MKSTSSTIFLYFFLFQLSGTIYSQDTTNDSWLSDGNGNVYTAENTGIGVNPPLSKFHIKETATLGDNLNDYLLIWQVQMKGGSGGNQIYHRHWALRDDPNYSDWRTWRLHDGLSVDTSFDIPGSTSKVWWERDPYTTLMSWGDLDKIWMTIDDGNVGIGKLPDEFRKLDILSTDYASGAYIFSLRSETSPAGTNSRAIGAYFQAANGDASISTDYMAGLESRSIINTTTGNTVNYAFGIKSAVENRSTGNITNTIGLKTEITNYSTGTGTINSGTGIEITIDEKNGNILNGYGLSINDIIADNGYGIYQKGSDDINYLSGKTGFYNNTPLFLVDIGSTTFGETVTTFDVTTDYGMRVQRRWNNTTDAIQGGIRLGEGYTGIAAIDEGSGGAVGFSIFVGNANNVFEAIRINNNGNITINSGDMDINGKINAQEIQLQQDALPDYVFADDYSLMPINKVESYIKENKHLPEMPSAQEAQENGINIGEMQAKLLQKIEELTLYVIDMNKEMETIKKENQQLKEILSSK